MHTDEHIADLERQTERLRAETRLLMAQTHILELKRPRWVEPATTLGAMLAGALVAVLLQVSLH